MVKCHYCIIGDDASQQYMRRKLESKNEVVVYTALFGSYDKLLEPTIKSSKCKFICFTDDKNLKSNFWEIRLVDGIVDPIAANRKMKFLPHQFLSDFKYSLYIDSNIKIIHDPYDLIINYVQSFKINIPRHFERQCIYDELNECYNLNKINKTELNNLNQLFISEGYPRNNGLGENNIIIREHNDPVVINLMQEWWFFFSNGPKRDQLSLMFLAWKLDIPINLMRETSRNRNKYFRYHLHLNEEKLPFIKRKYLYVRANRDRHFIYQMLYKLRNFF